MSHVVQIKSVPVLNLEALEAAAVELGGTLVRNKKTYNWFGRSVGDYKLPEGMKAEDLGKCEHVVKFPGINYEVGFQKSTVPVKTDAGEVIPDGLYPIYDFWGSDKSGTGHDGMRLKETIGEGAGLLMQAYSKHAAIQAAELQGYTVSSCYTDAQGNVQLELLCM